MSDFIKFPKMPRLSREIIITEKIDGTNAQIFISEDGTELTAGSRNRWITPEADNYGFAKWCMENKEDLLTLGPGRHYGEWWGQGIQCRYGMDHKVFSLFNVDRWTWETKPSCCSVVPVLFRGPFDTEWVDSTIESLEHGGSIAAPGFQKPEGIIIYHTQGRFGMKKTIEGDDSHKSIYNKESYEVQS